MANTKKSKSTTSQPKKRTYKKKTHNKKVTTTKTTTSTKKIKVDLEKQKRINTYKYLMIILLVIILILLLLQKCGVYDKKEELKDNYDIYEIECDCKEEIIDDDKTHNIDDNKKNHHNNNNNNNNQGNNNKEDNNNSKDTNSNENSSNTTPNPDKGNDSNNNKQNNNNTNNTNNNTNNNNSSSNTNENNPEEPTTEQEFELEVIDDDNNDWNTNNELHIFSNPMFEMKNIIAPGSSNSYKFYIKNDNECDISYRLEFQEENPYGIHMKYKLKYNGEYITSNYVSYDKLNTTMKRLNASIEDEYILEWKWEHYDEIDTLAGKDPSQEYKLQIKVLGEQAI